MDYYRQNQLPATVRRYRQYKHPFQDWLINTAIQRGIEIANVAINQARKGIGKNEYKLHIAKQKQVVNAIAAADAPLVDTSGINDLNDAIRRRKEVSQYHKYNNTADERHASMENDLEELMATLRNLVPPKRRPRDREDAKETYVVVFLSSAKSRQEEQEALLEKAQEQDESENIQEHQKHTL
jgi:hypothetical protein